MLNEDKTTTKIKNFSPADAVSFAVSKILSYSSDFENIPQDAEYIKQQAEAIIPLISERLAAEPLSRIFPTDVITGISKEIYHSALSKISEERLAAAAVRSVSSDPLISSSIDTLIFNNAASIFSFLLKLYPPSSLFSSKDKHQQRVLLLVVAFTAHALSAYHPSGWIRYDKKQIFSIAKINKLPSQDQEALTRQIHNDFGLNMRVIGSNQPIPCYNIPWLVAPQQDSPISTLRSPMIANAIVEKIRFLVNSISDDSQESLGNPSPPLNTIDQTNQ